MTILLGAAVLILLVALAVVWHRARTAEADAARVTADLASARRQREADAARFAETADTLRSRVADLSKWEGVEDADRQARDLIARAEAAANQLLADAAHIQDEATKEIAAVRTQAQEEAAAVRRAAQDEAGRVKAAAQATERHAAEKADAIIAVAEVKAQEIAGDALKALREATELEATVEALRNTIEGYGDRYIVPTHSLLDDLAQHFGHTEAGQKLKDSREVTRRMVVQARAAACDYVEPTRRDTAVRFVIDAFNGKVDSILARVKHDNAGTLAQEIRDAFSLVNINGRAFRNARIVEEYRDARLQELHWAAVAQELKIQEREEQRRIREQIREEEKARREIERALKDAAKEEELLKKAMEKAQGQMARASDAQKAMYEEQLAALAAKLKAAEERNQRALSMAQQTRRGHVYVISNVGSFGENVYKIGLTRRLEPLDRIRELGDSSVPFEFDVHALIFSDDAPALECQLHKHFVFNQINKVNYRKEFFRVDVAHIRSELETLGITAQWTMAAEAREYRESQAIERAIATDPAAREAWRNRQLQLDAVFGFPDEEDDTSAGVTAPSHALPVSAAATVAAL